LCKTYNIFGRKLLQGAEMVSPTWQIIIAILSSSAFTGVLLKIIELIAEATNKKKKEEREATQRHNEQVDEALVAFRAELEDLREDNLVMMHDRIYAMFKKFEHADTITASDKANLDYLWERYSNRKGNHDAEILYKIVDAKPVVPGGITE
jgi:hypothetical protein